MLDVFIDINAKGDIYIDLPACTCDEDRDDYDDDVNL